MNRFDLFPTTLWMGMLDIDVSIVLESIDDGIICDDLFKEIKDNIPKSEVMDVPETHIHYWINFNRTGDFNRRHHHTDITTLFSGVYYLKVPSDSGRIIFHDPRSRTIDAMMDTKYCGYQPEVSIDPQPGMIIYFPSWLEHEVEMNESDDERISIAFNITSVDELDRYKDMENFYDNNAIATRPDGRTEFFIS